MEQTKISIFGSCISRDMLEFDTDKRLDLMTYIARQSVMSAVAGKCEFDENRIKLDSPFQKRMVISDLRKDAFDTLSADGSEYLIIDLADERFPVGFYNGTAVTVSNELVSSSLLSEEEISNIITVTKEGNSLWDDVTEVFCRRLTEIYSDRIIIHIGRFLDEYTAADGTVRTFGEDIRKNNEFNNNFQQYMYSQIIQNIPDAKVIDISEDFRADENHKWGLSPVHYPPGYYKAVLNEVIGFIDKE